MLNRILAVSVFNHSPKQYISELKQNSPALQDINEQFRKLVDRLQIFSFFETHQTSIGPRKMMVLEKDSSTLEYPSEVSKPLDADHHNVCKFTSRQDPNYVSVRNALKYVLPKKQGFEQPSRTSSAEIEQVDLSKVKRLLAVSSVPEDDLEDLQNLWMPGSCEWILSRPVFQSWLDDESARSRILWVYGLPGCGKSVLSSFVIRHLQDKGHNCQYFFFSFGDYLKRTISLLLRSLAYQIATVVPEFRAQLGKLADDNVRLEKAEGRTIWQKLFKSKLSNIRLQKPIYWIIDALDECDAPEKLLGLLSFIDTSRCPLRVMLVSRKTQGLSLAYQRLQSSVQVDHLNIGDVKEDLESYAAQEIAYVRGGPEIKARITRTICAKANGNFLWVHLVIKEIMQCHTEAGIEEALHELPPDLEPLYERMEKSLTNSLRPADKDLSKRILTWAICAQRALTLEELTEALKPEHNVLDLRITISQVCGDFVVVDSKGRIGMVHESAREYLVKTSGLEHSIAPRVAHQNIFLKCITHLTRATRGTRIERSVTQPLVHYAAIFWPYHLDQSSVSQDHTILLALHQFFQSRHVLLWIQLLAILDHLRTLIHASQILTSYLRKKAKVDVQTNPTTPLLQERKLLELWAVDLVKVVGKFGVQLVKYPKAVQTLVPALSPSKAIIHQQFTRTKGLEPITVSGLLCQRWDDCLSKFSVGWDYKPLRIVCMNLYFAILTSDGTVQLYDAVTHQPSREMAHGELVFSFSFSASQEQCITSGFRTTKVWDVESGRPTHSITNPTNVRALDVAFSRDESAVISCSNDRLVRQWSFKTSRATEPAGSGWQVLEVNVTFAQGDDGHYSSPSRVAFNADGTRMAVVSRGFPLAVYDIPNNELLGLCVRVSDKKKGRLHLYSAIKLACWNPVTGYVLGLYNDGCVFKWYPSPTDSDSQELRTIATGIRCSPGGDLFATSDCNGLVKIWDFHHFVIVYQLSGHYPVTDLASSPDGRRIYDIRRSYCNIWEPNALVRWAESDEKASETSRTAASSTQLSAASEAASEMKEPVTALTIGSRTASSYCLGNDVGMVRLHTPISEGVIAQGFTQVNHIVWSDDETLLATADLAGRLHVRSLDLSETTPRCTSVLETKTPNGLLQILISPTSEYLLLVTTSLTELWSIATKSIVTTGSHASNSHSRWINHPSDSGLFVQCTFFELFLFRWSQREFEPYAIFLIHKGLNQAESEHDQASTAPPTELERFFAEACPSLANDRHVVHQTFTSSKGLILMQTSSRSPFSDYHCKVQYLTLDSSALKAPGSVDTIGALDIQTEKPWSLKSEDRLDTFTQHQPISSVASNDHSPIAAVKLTDLATRSGNNVLGFVTRSARGKVHGVIGESDTAAEEVIVFVDHDDWVCSMALEHESRTSVDVKRHFFLPQDWLELDNLRLATVSRDGTLYYPRNGEVAVVSNWLQHEWAD